MICINETKSDNVSIKHLTNPHFYSNLPMILYQYDNVFAKYIFKAPFL